MLPFENVDEIALNFVLKNCKKLCKSPESSQKLRKNVQITCRARKTLQNEPLVANIGVDPAKNGPWKVLKRGALLESPMVTRLRPDRATPSVLPDSRTYARGYSRGPAATPVALMEAREG